MPICKGETAEKVRLYVIEYGNWLSETVYQPVQRALQLAPQRLIDTRKSIDTLRDQLGEQLEVEPALLPLLKRAIIHARRMKASEVERWSGLTFNHDIRVTLEEEKTAFSALMDMEWFKKTEMAASPQITDFLSIHGAEKFAHESMTLRLAKRDYDEKFHILNAPTLFFPDLAYYRVNCELRGVPLSVAYIDIDDFKEFNNKYTEPRVDRDVLPKFMSALEAHIYSHGFAYRKGGDEYAVILPNASIDQAVSLMASFQDNLRVLQYFGIKEHTAISVGIVEVNESCMLTDQEIEERAAFAKKHAKNSGRNRIARYEGHGFEDGDVIVAHIGGSSDDAR